MESYKALLRDILRTGNMKMTRAKDPATGKNLGAISVFGRTWSHDLSQGFPLLTTKKVFWKGVKEELLWFLRGETNVTSLQAAGVKIWNEWAYDPAGEFGGKTSPVSGSLEPGDVGPIYGFQWRRWYPGLTDGRLMRFTEVLFDHLRKGEIVQNKTDHVFRSILAARDESFAPIDQLARVIKTLRTNPFDRRLIVSAWNPADIDKMGLPPCHYAFQFGVRIEHDEQCPASPRTGGQDPMRRWRAADALPCACLTTNVLDCIMHMRSADAFLGVPFNIASYALLTRMVAQVTGIKPGVLGVTFGDLHIYENHLDQVETQLARSPKRLPEVSLNMNVREIDDFLPDDIVLNNYDPHPAIAAPVGV